MYPVKDEMSIWTKIACIAIVVVATGYLFFLARTVYTGFGPTYSQVCAPLSFHRMIRYYDGRTFLVCGTPTTEPVLKEYPRQ